MAHVAAPGRHGDGFALHAEAQGPEDLLHLAGRHAGSQQGVDPLGPQLEDRGLGDVVEDVDHTVHHLAGSQQLHQLTGPVDGGQGVQGIQALLELGGRLGAHPQGQGGLADAGAVEIGGLEDYVHRVGCDLAVLAAHDARQAHGPGIVGDDQHVLRQLPDIAVQGGQLLAVLRPADNDLPALDVAVVEGVHGLAVLQHDVVGDVHDVVDGPHAHAPQPLPHPLGGGGDLYIADHPGGIPGTQQPVRGFHVQQFHQVPFAAALDHGLMEPQGRAEGGGRLPSQADDGQAVRPVGGDLELHHVVIGVDDGPDVVAGFHALLPEDKDAVGDTVGELPLLCVKVRQGADGVGFFIVSHQVAHMDVITADVRADRSLSHVHAGVVAAVTQGHTLQDLRRYHRPEDFVPGLNVRRDGGLLRVNGFVVVQQGGGGNGGVGEIPLVQAQLAEGTEHAVGEHAPELALFDLLPAGEGRLVEGHRHHIPFVDVPGPGDDLDGLLPAHVQLADPHMVAVGVALHLHDAARRHVLNLRPQVLRDLHLGAGEGHGLGKFFIIGVNGNKLAEPFSA